MKHTEPVIGRDEGGLYTDSGYVKYDKKTIRDKLRDIAMTDLHFTGIIYDDDILNVLYTLLVAQESRDGGHQIKQV